MDLCWEPKVHSRFRVDVPEMVVPYDPLLKDKWKAYYKAWLDCNRTDCLVWGDYRLLAEEERLYLPTGGTPNAERFVEFHAALLLEQQGFKCWGGVQLFKYGKNLIKGQENTQAVQALWKQKMRRPWPNDTKETLELAKKERPRNPDIVAYHERRNEWRFCEVKGDDPVDPYQTMALAILHLLTGAPVAIVRLEPRGSRHKSSRKSLSPPHEVEIASIVVWLNQRCRLLEPSATLFALPMVVLSPTHRLGTRSDAISSELRPMLGCWTAWILEFGIRSLTPQRR